MLLGVALGAAMFGLGYPAAAQVPVQQYVAPHSSPASETYAGPNPRALAFDETNLHTYVAGSNPISPTVSQIGVWSYDAAGNLRTGFPIAWPHNLVTGSYHGITVEVEMVQQTASSIFVAGVGPGNGTGLDTFLVHYDLNGNFIWKGHFNNPYANLDDIPIRIIPNISTCDVFVVGTSAGQSTGNDFFVARFDKLTGTLLNWIPFDGGANLQDKANDAAGVLIAQLGTGSTISQIYITGTTFNQVEAENYLTVGLIAYEGEDCESRTFGPSWQTQFTNPGGPIKSVDDAKSLVILADGVAVTGASQAWDISGSNEFDYVTVKYDDNGVQQWVNRWNGPGNGADVPYRIAGARFQNNSPELHNYLYVTGGTWWSPQRRYDIGTVAINPNDGALVWDHFHRSSELAFDDIGHDLKCIPGDEFSDQSGGVYVTGRGVDLGGNIHFVTYRLRRSPAPLSDSARMQWPSPYVQIVDDRGDDVPTTLVLRELVAPGLPDLSEVFVTGRSPAPSGGATVRYTQSP